MRKRWQSVPPFLHNGDAALAWALRHIADYGPSEDDDHMTAEHQMLLAEDRAYTYSDFAHEVFDAGKVRIYRAIRVGSLKSIELNNLGTSWSARPEGAGVYNSVRHTGRLRDVVLVGEVLASDVDWEYALESFMIYGESQWEVSVQPGAPITVVSVDGVPVDPPFRGNAGVHREAWISARTRQR